MRILSNKLLLSRYLLIGYAINITCKEGIEFCHSVTRLMEILSSHASIFYKDKTVKYVINIIEVKFNAL